MSSRDDAVLYGTPSLLPLQICHENALRFAAARMKPADRSEGASRAAARSRARTRASSTQHLRTIPRESVVRDVESPAALNINNGRMWCRRDGCSVRATFGRRTEDGGPMYCSAHATMGMADMRKPRCRAERCALQPAFGFPNNGSR